MLEQLLAVSSEAAMDRRSLLAGLILRSWESQLAQFAAQLRAPQVIMKQLSRLPTRRS
jgi:hypothetical protein